MVGSAKPMAAIYRSASSGDWEFVESGDEPGDAEWRQLRAVPGMPAVQLRLKAQGEQPPGLLEPSWALHVVEKRQLFLQAFVFWGRMAFYDMGLTPESFAGGGSMFCELQLSEVIIPVNCFMPLFGFENEYETKALHPVHREFEFRSKWRGLEPVHVSVIRNDPNHAGVSGQVCLREGSLENNLSRAVDTYDKIGGEPFSAVRFQLLRQLSEATTSAMK